MYREANVHVLAARSSDHAPLLLQFSPRKEEMVNYDRRFKFKAKWRLEDEYNNILEGAWKDNQTDDQTGGSALHVVQKKLVTCQSILMGWSGRKYGDSRKILKQKTKALKELQKQEGVEDSAVIKKLKGEIELIMEQDDVCWK
jgi:hypothetical protein